MKCTLITAALTAVLLSACLTDGDSTIVWPAPAEDVQEGGEVRSDVDAPDDPRDIVETDDVAPTDLVETEEVDIPTPGPTGMAWAWHDPAQVEKSDPVEVQLENITHPEGFLSGSFAHVVNCLNRLGGLEVDLREMGVDMHAVLCLFEQTAAPDEEGNYLHIQAPDNMLDPDDPFAEVQVYYHMGRIHRFLTESFGFTELNRPLHAIVNAQLGLRMDGFPRPGWMSIDNAAYLPQQSLAEIEDMLGVEPPINEDTLIFFQGPTLDFAYDGSVVYHEYVHAAVGGERLQGMRYDEFGADMGPLALNEAHADYLPCSMTGDPVLGRWALGKLGGARDLSVPRRCPEHIMGQAHNDGRVFASALWAIREEIGAELTDQIVFEAMLGYHRSTGFEEATVAVMANAAALEPSREDEVRAIFADHGLPGCTRVKPFFYAGPQFVPGRGRYQGVSFDEGAPAFVQVALELPVNAGGTNGEEENGATLDPIVAVTLEWERRPDSGDDLMSLLGGEPSDIELHLALKPGSDPILWTYEGSAVSDSHVTIPVARDDDLYEVTFGGSCLEQSEHVFQLVNQSSGQGVFGNFTRVFHREHPADRDVASYDCP